MRYQILGPLRVSDDDGVSFISARKIEVLLTVLLVRSGQIVSIEQMMSELWNGRPPRRGLASLHVYISKLRKFLDRPGNGGSAIITRPPGYQMDLGGDEIDFHDFLRLVDDGRARMRQGDDLTAADHLENALALWRGPILDHVHRGPIVEGFVQWLTEVQAECTEMLMEALINLGRHREVIGRLHSLVAAHPLREVFYQQLMLALYRCDRKAEALGVYRTARQTLHDELGLEPCHALQELHQAILAADLSLLRGVRANHIAEDTEIKLLAG